MVVVGEEAVWKSEQRTFLACASGFYSAALPVADHASVVPASGVNVDVRPRRLVFCWVLAIDRSFGDNGVQWISFSSAICC
jgi:hypothetical protein